jgi:transposase-like protein
MITTIALHHYQGRNWAVSKARLVITAVVVEGRSQSEVAQAYGVSQGWVSRLVARYRQEGEVAFEPRSRRPKTSPAAVVERVLALRGSLTAQGLDAGPETIVWHLAREGLTVSAATVARYSYVLRHHSSAPGRIRTCNLLIRSQVLYPLSYGRLPKSASRSATRESSELVRTPRTVHRTRAEAPGFEPGMGLRPKPH